MLETVVEDCGIDYACEVGLVPSKEENASTLSQILQVGVPEKYYLSQRACLGILRRASARGKQLPEILRIALERQASASTGTTEA